jgi:putative oxidoreductase
MSMNKFTINTGRTLLALYFLLPGIMKFISWELHIGLMEKHGMPFVTILLPLAALTQISASCLILTNRFVTEAALILAAMIILINFSLHDFWNYSGIEGAHELQNFGKNLGIMGGMLVLAGFSYKKPQTETISKPSH